MQELEKILEEIDEEIEKERTMCEDIEDTPGWRLYEKTMQMAKHIIHKHLSRENDPGITRLSRDNDGWIPVEERLPEDGQTVLCTDGQYVYLVEYDADLDAPFGDVDNITDWQPSPEPYRPERSKK